MSKYQNKEMKTKKEKDRKEIYFGKETASEWVGSCTYLLHTRYFSVQALSATLAFRRGTGPVLEEDVRAATGSEAKSMAVERRDVREAAMQSYAAQKHGMQHRASAAVQPVREGVAPRHFLHVQPTVKKIYLASGQGTRSLEMRFRPILSEPVADSCGLR